MALVIEMPKLSDTMAVGTVVKWHKTIGEAVANGDILAEIETDKATMELENFEDGVLLDIFVEEGHEAPIGTPLAVVGNQGEDITSLIPAVDLASKDVHIENKLEDIVESKIEPTAALKDDLLDSESPSRQETNIDQKPTDRLLVSPLAKKIAEEKNIDLASIKGSGPRGRITKKDLENQNQSTSPLPIDTSADLANNSSGILSEKSIPLSKNEECNRHKIVGL